MPLTYTEQLVTQFIDTINRQMEELRTTSDLPRFQQLERRLQSQWQTAKTCLAEYERLADLWRGAETNLNGFHARIPHMRSLVERATAVATQAQASLPTSISDLLPLVTNEAQKQALQRLLYRHENNQIYLAGYVGNTAIVGRHADLEGTFTLLGTVRHGTRESYEIKWYRTPVPGRGSFWCSCPDHKFNSVKKQMVCKHICFLVCRVGRILDPTFFETKQLTAEQHEAFRTIVHSTALFTEGAAIRETLGSSSAPVIPRTPAREQSLDLRRAPFQQIRKPLTTEDTCPICYDEQLDATACLSCPTCSNTVHRECMEVWLERNRTCVYCRSTVWEAWRV